MRVDREHQLYTKVAQYLQKHYPHAIYRFDVAADLKLTKGQAVKLKKLHPKRGYPDLFIAYPIFKIPTDEERHEYIERYGKDGLPIMITEHLFAGLFLELKADGKSPFRKDGKLKKDKHLKEQQAMLELLRQSKYRAEFATGFEEAKAIIDDYFNNSLY
jgi:hypothetical protein